MKRLSDYKGQEAIDLWADLFDPLSDILTNTDTVKTLQKRGVPLISKAQDLLKRHSKEVSEILLRIDPAPINGLNAVTRCVALLNEVMESEEAKSFFGFADQEKEDGASFGSATENIEGAKK